MSEIKKIIKTIISNCVSPCKGDHRHDPILLTYTTQQYAFGNLSKDSYLNTLEEYYHANNLQVVELMDAINIYKEELKICST